MNASNNELWVVACCFNEAAGITNFIETVLAQPAVDRLLLIDDGSSDDLFNEDELDDEYDTDY